MNENSLLFITGSLKKFVRQQCKCKDSLPIDDSNFSRSDKELKDKFIMMITVYKDICDKCGIPYKVWYDTSNCLLVKNIGDEK